MPSTRERIIQTADELFYERGYDHSSFADIAAAVGLSRGNFYYHFKSKDEILDAVIEQRRGKTLAMLQQWETESSTPQAGLARFIDMMVMNSPRIRRHGCPVGTLCTELAKLEHPALPNANLLFSLFRQWLKTRFEEAGLGRHADAMAMHLLGRSQGIATLAQAFDSEDFIHQETAGLHQWLASLLEKPRAENLPKHTRRR